MQSILVFGVVSAAVSLLVQWLKNFKSDRPSWFSQAILIGVSLVGGGVYLYFQAHQDYWLQVVKVLAGADVIYSFVISKFEPPSTPE